MATAMAETEIVGREDSENPEAQGVDIRHNEEEDGDVADKDKRLEPKKRTDQRRAGQVFFFSLYNLIKIFVM